MEDNDECGRVIMYKDECLDGEEVIFLEIQKSNGYDYNQIIGRIPLTFKDIETLEKILEDENDYKKILGKNNSEKARIFNSNITTYAEKKNKDYIVVSKEKKSFGKREIYEVEFCREKLKKIKVNAEKDLFSKDFLVKKGIESLESYLKENKKKFYTVTEMCESLEITDHIKRSLFKKFSDYSEEYSNDIIKKRNNCKNLYSYNKKCKNAIKKHNKKMCFGNLNTCERGDCPKILPKTKELNV